MSWAKFHICGTQLITCFPKDDTVVKIPDGIKSIENGAFKHNETLTNIIIPNSVTSISDYAFQNCTSLSTITISDSVTEIGEFAFYNCNSLVSFTMSNNVTSIQWHTFDNCYRLKEAIIPNIDAIEDCASLKIVTFSSNLK